MPFLSGPILTLYCSNPSLGTPMTHHIRRLLMTPLPAFEGEITGLGGDVPPAVVAAGKCLSVCIEASRQCWEGEG